MLPQHLRDLFTGWRSTMYIDSPYLNGMTCVALACGVAKDCLRGRYIDVEHDLEDIIKQADVLKADKDLYGLVTKFPGGMKNDGGGERAPETPFEFPGW